MDDFASWRRLEAVLRGTALESRLATLAADAGTAELRETSPPEGALGRLLPADYTEFVTRFGYPAVHLGTHHSIAFLPPAVMRLSTEGMGDPRLDFDDVRRRRAAGTYEWPFALFAAWELPDVNGWCFGASQDEGTGVAVWAVEDSLPFEEVGTFSTWLERQADRLCAFVDSPAKVNRIVARVRREVLVEDDEPLPRVNLNNFGFACYARPAK
jgi:hypothetical protein